MDSFISLKDFAWTTPKNTKSPITTPKNTVIIPIIRI